MLKQIKKFAVALFGAAVLFTGTSCERVEPNYVGVFMENYGKAGKSDFSLKSGTVWVVGLGTELYHVPLYEQRGLIDSAVTLKAGDNTEFSVNPKYSYKIIRDRAIDVVFENRHALSGDGNSFFDGVEDNILEPRMYDLIREESRKYTTDELMSTGGSLKFEKVVEETIKNEFKNRGIELMTLSLQIEFSQTVKNKIDNRNEVNTNLSVLDQQIEEQKKRNELERLKAEQLIIRSQGISDKILMENFINKWDGKTPIYGNVPQLIKMTN